MRSEYEKGYITVINMLEFYGKSREEIIEELSERHPYIPIDVINVVADAILQDKEIKDDIEVLRPRVLEISRKEKLSQNDVEFLDKYAKLVDERRKIMRMVAEVLWKWRKEKVDLRVDEAVLVELAETMGEIKNERAKD